MNYKDGKYKTSAEGLHGNGIVETEFKDNKINNIKILSGAGDYQEKANQTIVKEILDKQVPEVDAVSGATVSSNAIMEAVKRAMQEASGVENTEKEK